MTRRLDQRANVTEILAAHVLEKGLADTSLRQLAKAAGVSDRMMLYYFEDKADVMTAVMQAIAARFTVQLDQAFPGEEPRVIGKLFKEIADLTSRPDLQPFMRVWIEAITSAARGLEPYLTVSRQIADGFLDWIETRLPDGATRRADAIMLLTMIEGLSVMLVCTDKITHDTAQESIEQILRS